MKNAEDISQKSIDDFFKLVGKNVKKYRERKGLSQLQLSLQMGYKSVGLISQAEIYHKKQHFNLKHLYYLAYILECEVCDFFEKD